MHQKQARSLDEIMRRAAALGPRERLAYLQNACGGDTVLFEALQRISGDWFAPPPDEQPASADEIEADRKPGEHIGPYRIMRVLGRGGMGEVYLCERADEQFRKHVAIKLVSRSLVSKQVQTRLRTERQILATLDHPNIARLLDGGTTKEGIPFLVMEYVDGEPIDTFCDKRKLTVEQRLQLFRTVCSAVHAAHQNLVVHRDLKPSNILVTSDGTPKLLDFGIAKLLDVRQTSHTVAVTQADIRILTPGHASPEQVRGDPITTASDVYVLGVLLYEMLCGQRPFNVTGLRLIDIEKVICNEQAALPSEALARADAPLATRIANERGTTPQRLKRQLAGDLDNIVMMAMRKEPERRYSSAEQLSGEVDLHSRGMPVIARGDTLTYHMRKFVQRHKLSVAAAAAFVLLLAGFAVTTYLQAQRISAERDIAHAQRTQAEAARTRAERVATFLVDLFRRADPNEARGQNITAREILERGARKIEVELANEPATQAQLMDAIGRVYLGLGEEDKALPLLERSLNLRRELYGPNDSLTAESLRSLGDAALAKGNLDKAQQLLEEALRTQVAREGPQAETVTATLNSLALMHRHRGNFAQAEKLLHQCLQRYLVAFGERDSRTTSVMNELANILLNRGAYVDAERLYRRALAVDRELLGTNHPQIALQIGSLATSLMRQGRIDEAEPLFREALPILRRVLGVEHADTIAAISSFGRLLQRKGDLAGAENALREAVALGENARGVEHWLVGYNMVGLAAVLHEQGRPREAEAFFQSALAIFGKALPPDHPYVGSALTGLARIYADAGDVNRVTSLVDRASAIWSKQDQDHWQIANTRAWLGVCWLNRKDYGKAEEILRSSYDRLLAKLGAADPVTQRVRTLLERVYTESGKPTPADLTRSPSLADAPATARR
jgi:serine/threonine protein kinase/tetratricopeptide (TPR) repeat protein